MTKMNKMVRGALIAVILNFFVIFDGGELFKKLIYQQNFYRRVILINLYFQYIGHARRATRVLQGSDAVPGEFPYMVSLRRWNVHVCGGAIISPRHILTAAHCFIGRADAPYTEGLVVITGASTNRTIGDVHRAKTVTPHTGFRSGSEHRWRHDIAVITVSVFKFFFQFIMFDLLWL